MSKRGEYKGIKSEFTQEKIGKILGIGPKTVRKYEKQAIKKIRKYLEQTGKGEILKEFLEDL